MSFIRPQGRKALENVAAWLEAGAPHRILASGLQVDRFDMSEPVKVDAACGTSCCIAGAVCQFEALGIDVRDHMGSLEWGGEDGAMDLAGAFLGMPLADQLRMFEPWNYFVGRDGDFNAAPRGAAVIRHYLATGKVDWDRFKDDGSTRTDDEIAELVRKDSEF